MAVPDLRRHAHSSAALPDLHFPWITMQGQIRGDEAVGPVGTLLIFVQGKANLRPADVELRNVGGT